MEKQLFLTECKKDLSNNDYSFLRSLYLPIIGSESIILYSLLNDYYSTYKNNPTYIELNDLSKIMDITLEKIFTLKKQLEAVGLIRTFKKEKNNHFIFLINPPLKPKDFRNNSLLYKAAISKIGEVIFERIYFHNQNKEIKKDYFQEVTTKYQDMFDIEEKVSKKIIETPDIIKFENKEEAIKNLSSIEFISFISNKKSSPSQSSMIQRIQELGLSFNSINEIIDYSFEKNNKIVSNHIEVIAKDLITKNITSSFLIKAELKEAKSSMHKTSKKPKIKKIIEVNNTSNNNSWNEILNSLGGSF